jgi:uncharacterized protein
LPRLPARRMNSERRSLMLLCGLLAAILLPSCKRSRQAAPAPLSSREFSSALKRVALAAGGGGIWVKDAAPDESFPQRVDEPLEVLATPRGFETVPTALEREARARGVRFELREAGHQSLDRKLKIRFLREGRVWAVWEIREVRRLRRAAIVIDDMGGNWEAAEKLLALPYPLTFSVLPHLRYSRQTAEAAHQAGRDIMLHLPMEPIPRLGFFPTPGEVREGMDRLQVERLVEKDLAAVPYVRGVNNHEGSRATEDPLLMADVMQVLATRHLYFIDSRTTGASAALPAARRAGLPAFYRSVFLDDTPNVAYILGQLKEFRGIIEEQGIALAIGHPHASTIRALAEFLPKFSEDDIELVPASRLVALRQAARLSPPRARKLDASKRKSEPAMSNDADPARSRP